jgi:hypothetical protein
MAHRRRNPVQALATSALVMLLGAGSMHCSDDSGDGDGDHPPPAPAAAGQLNTPVSDRPVGTQPGPSPEVGRGGTGGTSANDPFGAGDNGGTSSGGTNFVGAGGTNNVGLGGSPITVGGTPSFVSGGRAPFNNSSGL